MNGARTTMATDANDIKVAIKGLQAGELVALRDWIEEYIADQWDEQIERDIKAGKLDNLLKRALDNYASGNYRDI